MDTQNQIKLGEKGAWLSIITYIFMAGIKLSAGHAGNSEGLWADGLNNSTDIIASIAVLIGLKIARRPPDHNHAYGHYRAESIASLIAAFIMMTVGLQVIWDGLQSFTAKDTVKPDWLTAWTSLVCAIAMYLVYLYNLNLSQKINSPSIKAVAYDNRSDAFVSIGAFAGIAGTHLGLYLLDIITAIIVGLIICKTAWDIFKDSSHDLTDGFDKKTLTEINKTISSTPGVKKSLDVKARKQGNQILVEATIYVNPDLNVVESHFITEDIEKRLLSSHNVASAIIHIEPYVKNR